MTALATEVREHPAHRRPVYRPMLPPVVGSAVVGAFFLLWNLGRSPDTQYDEVVYSRADQAVAQNWSLTWTNRPLFVHPPLSFLFQALWLRIRGTTHGPLTDVIVDTRYLAALVTVANVVLLAMITFRLAGRARPRVQCVLALATALLAATDPVLLRFGRMAMIEPFALLGCLVSLHLAMALHGRRSRLFVPVLGAATGLTLLTNEVGIFMLLTPLVYALLAADRRLLRQCAAALAAGLALWSVFVLWAVELGLLGSFVEIKTVTFQRLIGTVQITGWNRPGVSLASGLAAQVGQYATSYAVLTLGAVAAVWLALRRGDRSYFWLLAWLVTSYSFGAYTVLLGTLNEQFFVYVVPAALVATVLMAEAVLVGRNLPAIVAWVLLAVALLSSGVSWTRFYVARNDGLARLTAYVAANLPPCAALNATGDAERFELLFPARPIATYATGPGALAHGVTLFVLSDKDAELRFGNSSPALSAWVRAHGTRLAGYPSATYRVLELWQVLPNAYDPAAGVERMAGGDFVVTEGSRCGGLPVVDGPDGVFATGWAGLGGKAVAGPPLTDSWRDRTGSDAAGSDGAGSEGAGHQVFAGAVLTSGREIDGRVPVTAEPVVRALAQLDPAGYRKAGLPPITRSDREVRLDREATGLLTDPAIAGVHQGAIAELLGAPLGPPATMPDNQVRQAFAAGVLEHLVGSESVRMAPVGRMALEAGLISPSLPDRTPIIPPPLPAEYEPPQPTSVEPFVWTLAGALVLYGGVCFALLRRHRRPLDPPDFTPDPPEVPGPAIGDLSPVPRRTALIRIGALALLLTVALVVRGTGVLHVGPSSLPGLPEAAPVAPGVVRAGQPAESDLVRLRDDYGIRAVIAVNGRDDSTLSGEEERAAAESIGLRYLRLRVADGAVLSAGQVADVAELLRAVRPSERTSPNLVLLHDRTGRGPVLLVAAAVRILDRQPVRRVLTAAAKSGLNDAQRASLTQLAAVIDRTATAGNLYATVRVEDW